MLLFKGFLETNPIILEKKAESFKPHCQAAARCSDET